MNVQLIEEGGSYGHLRHIYEDQSLTFSELKELIRLLVRGELTKGNIVTEKIDGLQLGVTFNEGTLKFTRSKEHVKNSCENALSFDELQQKFVSHKNENIGKVFISAAKELQSTFSSLEKSLLESIFKQGKRVLNCEIVHTNAKVTIPYSQNVIYITSLIEYTKDGEIKSEESIYPEEFIKSIKSVNSKLLQEFKIKEQVPVQIGPVSATKEKEKQYLEKLDKIVSTYKVEYSQTIKDAYLKKWIPFVREKLSQHGFLSPRTSIVEELSKTWSLGDNCTKEIKDSIKRYVDNEERANSVLSWISAFQSDGKVKEKNAEIKAPLELLFAEIGIEVLKNTKGLINFSSNEEHEKLKSEIDKVLRKIQNEASDIDTLKKFSQYIKKLDDLGGLDSIVPTEGIVFRFGSRNYKLTGAFSALHQLVQLVHKL